MSLSHSRDVAPVVIVRCGPIRVALEATSYAQLYHDVIECVGPPSFDHQLALQYNYCSLIVSVRCEKSFQTYLRTCNALQNCDPKMSQFPYNCCTLQLTAVQHPTIHPQHTSSPAADAGYLATLNDAPQNMHYNVDDDVRGGNSTGPAAAAAGRPVSAAGQHSSSLRRRIEELSTIDDKIQEDEEIQRKRQQLQQYQPQQPPLSQQVQHSSESTLAYRPQSALDYRQYNSEVQPSSQGKMGGTASTAAPGVAVRPKSACSRLKILCRIQTTEGTTEPFGLMLPHENSIAALTSLLWNSPVVKAARKQHPTALASFTLTYRAVNAAGEAMEAPLDHDVHVAAMRTMIAQRGARAVQLRLHPVTDAPGLLRLRVLAAIPGGSQGSSPYSRRSTTPSGQQGYSRPTSAAPAPSWSTAH